MLAQLFWTYIKVGTFTLGGGYAMIPLIQREIVDNRHWLDEEEFMNMIALSQAVPGIIAVNSAIMVGYQLGKKYQHNPYLFAFTAALGAVLPSFLIILAIAMFFSEIKHNPTIEAVFKGVRPAVVALITATVIRMAVNVFRHKP
ncbi:MAG: chromate transporter [Paludibacteraceae bacterium]|nr:chromate transporter [Paludibacteraceae bacterium]